MWFDDIMILKSGFTRLPANFEIKNRKKQPSKEVSVNHQVIIILGKIIEKSL